MYITFSFRTHYYSVMGIVVISLTFADIIVKAPMEIKLTVLMDMLEVSIISISVLIISEGKFGILFGVWNPAKRRMVIKTGVKDLVYYFFRLLSGNLPHGQNRT